MAAKKKTYYECSKCRHREPKWMGHCPSCGDWNTFFELEEKSSSQAARQNSKVKNEAEALLLDNISLEEEARIDLGMSEINRVLGGGLMPSSAVLLGGEPGIGKSTLSLQIASRPQEKGEVLYISGEESAAQIKARAHRLGLEQCKMRLFIENRMEKIEKQLQKSKPALIIVDSVQTLINEESGPVPGTVNQIKYSAYELISYCKENSCSLILIAHVTKEGLIAGPKVLEHMVDTVLYFEQSRSDLRLLRAVKNRFGSIDEIGLFQMTQQGLKQIDNPSALFLLSRKGPLPAGIAITPVYEGSRSLMIEIQALTVAAKSGISRVYSDKIDNQRISRLAAVLEKSMGLSFTDQDIYINVAGGIRLSEVAVDLPIAMALFSARTGKPLPEQTVISGEVTLAGEIRSIKHSLKRARAAAELGFKEIILPEEPGEGQTAEIRIKSASSITEAVGLLFKQE